MTKDDHLRRDFICRLHGFDAEARNNLLRIEQDDEITELKRVALEIQHFEMAFVLNHELRRRGRERPVDELEAQIEDNRHNVIKTVDELRGWHISNCWLHKPGVYQMYISRHIFPRGAKMIRVFANQKIVTTAIELGYLSRPNGFTLP